MMPPEQKLDLGRSAGREPQAAGHPRVRALIADQDALARRMMQDVLPNLAGLVVIGGARDGREAVQPARHYPPELLLVDIALPPAGGVELIRQVAPILDACILTVSAAADVDEAVLAALHTGAIGHIDKDIEPDEFVRLVMLALSGQAIVPRRVTARERLVLSPTTVYSHVRRVLHKLGVHSRFEAVAAAQRLRQQEASIESPAVARNEAGRAIHPVRRPRKR